MIYKFTDKVKGKVVSSLILYTVKLPSRNLGVIEEVQTLEEYRQQGRATKLINKAIEKAQSLNLDCIELTVRDDNKIVQDFYKKIGFIDRLNHSYRLCLSKK